MMSWQRFAHLFLGLVCIAFGMLIVPGQAMAEKVTVAYFENAPAPIGTITSAQIDTLKSSDFTHVIFAFVNFCLWDATAEKCTADQNGNTVGGSTVVWNLNPVYPMSGPGRGKPYAQAVAAIQELVDAGKIVYVSLGGWANDETWSYASNSTNAKNAAKALQKFSSDYHVTGIDFDFETSSAAGFSNLGQALGALVPAPPISISPYSTAPPSWGVYSSAQWQVCELYNVGVSPTLVNRQYYAGGHTSNVPRAVQGDLVPFQCTISGSQGGASTTKTLVIPQSVLNVGLAPTSSQVPSDQANCEPAQASPIYGGCQSIAASVVASYPNIAGTAVWTYDVLSNPTAWASEMSQAMNGTSLSKMTGVHETSRAADRSEFYIAYWSGEEPTGVGHSPTLEETPDYIDVVPLFYVPVSGGDLNFDRLVLHNDQETIKGWMTAIRQRQKYKPKKTRFTLALIGDEFPTFDAEDFAEKVIAAVDDWGVDGVTIDYEPPSPNPKIIDVVAKIRTKLHEDSEVEDPIMTAPIYAAWFGLDPNLLRDYAAQFDYLSTMDYSPYVGSWDVNSTVAAYERYAAIIGGDGPPAYDKIAIGVSCMVFTGPQEGYHTPLDDVIDFCKYEPAGGKKLGMMLFTLSYDTPHHDGYPYPAWTYTRTIHENLP